jgi:uncharacterized protein with HEPN domain
MRRDAERLQHILEAPDSVAQIIAGRTEAEFLSDTTLCYAVAHRLTVVGEAAGRINREMTDANSSVPWPDIAGLRNILVHQYFRRRTACSPASRGSRENEKDLKHLVGK